MKKIILCGFNILVALILTLTFTACGDGAGGGEEYEIGVTYYTVTFVTFNATAPAPIKVAAGSKISQPATPEKTGDLYNAKLSKWNTDIAVAWDFDTDTVNDDMTLTAVWTAFDIGDTGPGGGTIVYRDSGSFPRKSYFVKGDDGASYLFVDRTCYYLEAAKIVLFNTYRWASIGKESESIATNTPLGYGIQNTYRIIENDPYAPAAKFCTDFRGGNKTDWFLPNATEFNYFYTNRIAAGYSNDGLCWISTQEVLDNAIAINMNTGAAAPYSKLTPLNVIPMRVF